MGAPRSRLTRFQAEPLEAFFRREGRFFLTGGAALAGYHLGHREAGASWQDIRTAPEFRRILLSREDESVIVDLVIDHAEQLRPEKPLHVPSGWIRPRRSSRTSCAPSWGARRPATSSTSARSKASASLRGLIDRLVRLAHP